MLDSIYIQIKVSFHYRFSKLCNKRNSYHFEINDKEIFEIYYKLYIYILNNHKLVIGRTIIDNFWRQQLIVRSVVLIK